MEPGGNGAVTRTARMAAALAAGLGILLSIAPIALAEAPQSVLEAIRKRTTNDVLNYQLYLDADCLLDTGRVAEAIEEVVARSLIRPVGRLAVPGGITLIVTADCMLPTASSLGVFSLEVAYVALVDRAMWKLDWEYGSLGVGAGEFILAQLEEQVEDAILDFIRAHI